MLFKKLSITKKDFFVDYLLSIAIELAILFGLIFFCGLFYQKGKIIQSVHDVGGELTSPTVGRLAYAIISFVLFAILLVGASLCAKYEADVPAFWMGFASGILLWQSIGEMFWHFTVGGYNFVRLECIQAFPLVVLFVAMLIYAYRRRSFDWGVWITIVSFACNWLGHYITIGVYPFFAKIISAHTWNVLAGSVGGGILLVLSIIYLFVKGDTRKGRMFASVLTYISLGVIALSILEG